MEREEPRRRLGEIHLIDEQKRILKQIRMGMASEAWTVEPKGRMNFRKGEANNIKYLSQAMSYKG